MTLRLALIDNYDSYTYNLSHLLAKSNSNVLPTLFRADAYPSLSALTVEHGTFDAYILSPGPGTPSNPADFPPLEAQILAQRRPVLAVCLGFQALCYAHGANIACCPAGPVHGRISVVKQAPASHDCPLLQGLPSSFSVVRYHSLHVDISTMSNDLLPTAWTTDHDSYGQSHAVLMAVRHRHDPLFGVQFHPESICTQYGKRLIENFLQLTSTFRTRWALERPLSVARVRNSQKPTLRTLVRQIQYTHLDSSDIFVALYGKKHHAFWLDSSSAVKTASSLSRCSSPDVERKRGPVDVEGKEKHFSACRNGRFSIMGAFEGPLSELITYDVTRKVVIADKPGHTRREFEMSIFDYLESNLQSLYSPPHPDLPMEMNGGYVGYFGYELKADVDGVKRNLHTSKVPDSWFIFTDRFILFDHESDDSFMVALVPTSIEDDDYGAIQWFEKVLGVLKYTKSHNLDIKGSKPFEIPAQNARSATPSLKFTPERSRSSYLEDIRRCLQEIRDGESYEICLTNRLRTVLPDGGESDPLQIYLALRLVNPAPYSAFLRLSSHIAVCCSSPERFLQIGASGGVESKPIKGTISRGKSVEEDEALRLQLQKSPKDRSENLMIVDLVRNDLSRTCSVGSVQVPKLMQTESYATVHQLVSTVTGTLLQSECATSCVRAAYPMGSMTGAPKVRTMEIIDRLERSSRGIYSGSIGYLSVSGAADLNVVIRTAVLDGKKVEIGVGGAIVALSGPEEEYDEVILKGKAIMQSLALKTTGRSEFIIAHECEEKQSYPIFDQIIS